MSKANINGDVLGDNNHIGDYTDNKNISLNLNSELTEFERNVLGYIHDNIENQEDRELLEIILKDLSNEQLDNINSEKIGALGSFVNKLKEVGEVALAKSFIDYLQGKSGELFQQIKDLPWWDNF